jgi:hypothetical protein
MFGIADQSNFHVKSSTVFSYHLFLADCTFLVPICGACPSFRVATSVRIRSFAQVDMDNWLLLLLLTCWKKCDDFVVFLV